MEILVGVHAAHDEARDVLVVHMLFPSACCGAFIATDARTRQQRDRCQTLLGSHGASEVETSPHGIPGGRQVRGKTRSTSIGRVGQAATERHTTPATLHGPSLEGQIARARRQS